MLGYEIEDRIQAYDRVDSYYERNGLDIPDRDSLEYRERFYDELSKIEGEGC